MAASLGHFGAAEGAEEALEMPPATNLQSSAGAGRVQGGCEYSSKGNLMSQSAPRGEF